MPKEWVFRVSPVIWPSREEVEKVVHPILARLFHWRASLNYTMGWRDAGDPVKDWIAKGFVR